MVDPIKIADALEHISAMLEINDLDGAAEFLRDLHPADAAEVLVALEPEVQAVMVSRLNTAELAATFEQMYEDEVIEVAQHLDMETLADVLDEMEPDTAADVLGELEPDAAAELLKEMDDSAPVASLLAHDEDTAGGIMNTPPPSLRRWMTVAEAFRFLKENYHDEEQLHYLYVLDRYGHLIGVVSLRALILADPAQTLEEIMSRDIITVSVDMDQEAVAQLFSRYDFLALPVVDAEGKLVGIITVDDVVDVLEEEATEDIYRLAQLSEDAELFSPIPRAVRNRLPWLMVNIATAFVAASVVSLFEDTIAQVAILAAFMPIVAGQGGNAGTQSMTIVVRSLALNEVTPHDALPALWHELRVGAINGLVVGSIVGAIAWLWQGIPALGLILAVAMLGNMMIAALAGVSVPMALKKLGIDPALASGVFVTNVTDVAGFLLFLGLATLLLSLLG